MLLGDQISSKCVDSMLTKWTIFTHLKLWVVVAKHNFKRVELIKYGDLSDKLTNEYYVVSTYTTVYVSSTSCTGEGKV